MSSLGLCRYEAEEERRKLRIMPQGGRGLAVRIRDTIRPQ
jgi:hypothetical protein